MQPKNPLKFVLTLFAFLMLSVPAFSQGTTPAQPAATCKEYTALGKLYYSKADYQAAYVVFRNCLVLEPKNTDALYNLARVELHLRLYQAAITHMKSCIDIDGQFWRCYLVLAQTYVSQYTDSSDRALQKGQLDEALSVLDDAERIVSTNEAKAAVNNLRGTIYKYKKEPDNAVKFFKQALQFSPEDPIVLFNLGALYLQLSKYDEAVDVLRQALDARPSDFITQAFYCKALRLNGKTNEALSQCKQAYNRSASARRDGFVVGQYGIVLYLTKDKNQARQMLELAVKLDPLTYHENYYYLGRLYLELGQAKDSSAQFTKAVLMASDEYVYWFWLGQANESLGKKDDACTNYARSLKIKSDYKDAQEAAVKLKCPTTAGSR